MLPDPGATDNADLSVPAGIHCANPDCRTRTGERTRGHQSCHSFLCGHCCQVAARSASGHRRPICKVHSRRIHTGHRPLAAKDQYPSGLGQDPPLLEALEQARAMGKTKANIEGVGVVSTTSWTTDVYEKRSKLEQRLMRSLTLVIWYKVHS